MSDAAADRRRAARIPVALTVELRNESGFSIHSSDNLSAGGAYFDRAIPHPLGSKVRVSLRLPGDELAITCDGEVVNIPDAKNFGMGVRFLNLSKSDAERLETFLSQVQKPAKPGKKK